MGRVLATYTSHLLHCRESLPPFRRAFNRLTLSQLHRWDMGVVNYDGRYRGFLLEPLVNGQLA